MDEEDLYDEFGNFIGDGLPKLEEEEEPMLQDTVWNADSSAAEYEEDEVGAPEDTGNLPTDTALEIYGKKTEVLVEVEDRQSTDMPLVAIQHDHSKGPLNTVFTHLAKNLPKTVYDREYMIDLASAPERVRNVAVIGALHSGKTSLLDLLVVEAHKHVPHITRNVELGWKQLRYTDNTKLEIERGLTTKLNGITILATDLTGKSTVLNLLDAPGHVNFMDQTAVALAASDCAIICIDVVEGLTSIVEHLIKQCQRNSMSIIFVLNKIDRLIIELKLPPIDAYLKLNHIVEQINRFTNKTRYSPELGNVVFASAKLEFTFTIEEFVNYFYESQLSSSEREGFVQRLWGDFFFDEGKFSKSPESTSHQHPTFVEFILVPIYKIFTHVLSCERAKLQEVLKKYFAIEIDSNLLKYDPLPLLKAVLKNIFRTQAGLIQSLASCSSAADSSSSKLQHLLKDQNDFSKCDLLAHAVQTMDYGGTDWSLVRVYHGEISRGAFLRVLDSSTASTSCDTSDDEEYEEDDFSLVEVTDIALLGGRYLFPITRATEGQVVLLKGISNVFNKSATLFLGTETRPPLFKSIDYINEPVFRIVIEPQIPTELPKLLDGLNRVSKYYPGVMIKVEESGEHVIVGFGELYLDSLLYDLRINYAGIEIKISEPLTVFSEGCSGESFAAIPVTSPNGKVSFSIGADPLDYSLAEDLSQSKIEASELQDPRKLSKILRETYGWDSLSARSVLSFQNGNCLIDDTLPDETDKELLSKYKNQIIQGFLWAIREGPLAEEQIYRTRFKLLEANGIEDLDIDGQLIPMVRKACYIALLTATPVLLEPIYEVDIIFHSVLLPIIEELLKKRRGGRIYKTTKIVTTPLSECRAQIPVIESAGFETDLRLATRGKAMCQLHFWSKIWRKVPGDVMDKDAPIPKLKPAPISSLSRDFVMKTRRRKGLSNEGFMSKDGPSLRKYIKPEMFNQLCQNGLI